MWLGQVMGWVSRCCVSGWVFAGSEIQQSAIVSDVSRLLTTLHGIAHDAGSTGCQDPRLRTQCSRKISLRVSKKFLLPCRAAENNFDCYLKQLAILLSDVELFNLQFVTALPAPMLCALL